MDDNQEHNHDSHDENYEYEEPPVKPLWECVYWDDVNEQVKTINVFGCCIFCASTQCGTYLDEELGEGQWTIIKLEQMINVNIVNIEFAQYDEEEDDCDINPGLEDGQEVGEFSGRRCKFCQSVNLVPTGMQSFKCSKCGTTNTIASDK